ncbi:MAG: hypothetical protein ACOC14_05200 [Bacillota bacterium]
MKTKLLWILPLAVLLLIIVLYTMVPHVYRFWFNVRHLLVYGLSGYLLTMGLFLVLKALIAKFNPSKTLKYILVGFFSSGLMASLVLLSNLQMKYIELYEVPPLESCAYYDNYGNFLYATQYEGSCSDPSDVHIETVDGKETLSFMLEETFNGPGRNVSLATENIGVEAYHLESQLNIEVTLTYFDKKQVESVEVLFQETMHKTNDYDGSKTTVGNLEYKLVENTVDENGVTIVTKSSTKTLNENGHRTIDFPEKDTLLKEETSLSSVIYPNDDHSDHIDIARQENTGSDAPVTYILRGEYRTLNEPLFLLDFYEDGRFNGSRLDASFGHDEIMLSSRIERSQWAGVERGQESRRIHFESPPPLFMNETAATDDFYLLSGFKADLNAPVHLDSSYTIDYREADDSIYAIHDATTSKFKKTDYGFKVEDYSTRRYSNGSYYPTLNMENVQEKVLVDDVKTTFDTMYDYESMLNHPGQLSDYHFYQWNPLLEGHFLPKD